MQRTLAIAIIAASAAVAQRAPHPAGPERSASVELKAYLNLSDSQLQSLESLRQQQDEAARPILEQIAAKHIALGKTLAGNPDASSVGQAMLDIGAFEKQLEQNATAYRDQARALLNQEQKTKLATLEGASKLAPSIAQAAGLNLLASPVQAPTHVMPAGPAGIRHRQAR